MATEIVDGARVHFGPVTSEGPAGGRSSTYGATEEIVWDFSYNDLPTTSATDINVDTIPAYAHIVECKLMVKTAFVGGTSLEVGTWTPAGVAVDADGLIPAAVGVTANLALGNVIAGRGVQVVEAPDAAGTAHVDGDGVYVASATGPIPSVDCQVKVAAVGTFTAGTARMIVRYIRAV